MERRPVVPPENFVRADSTGLGRSDIAAGQHRLESATPQGVEEPNDIRLDDRGDPHPEEEQESKAPILPAVPLGEAPSPCSSEGPGEPIENDFQRDLPLGVHDTTFRSVKPGLRPRAVVWAFYHLENMNRMAGKS